MKQSIREYQGEFPVWKAGTSLNKSDSSERLDDEHNSRPNDRLYPNEYQCFLLRALAKGDRLFVEKRRVKLTDEWTFGKPVTRKTPRQFRNISEVLMTGGMEPNIWDVRFLKKRGYLRQEGSEYVLTEQGKELVAARGRYVPPKEFTEEDA